MAWYLIGFAALAVLGMVFVGLLGYKLGRAMMRRADEALGAWARRRGVASGLAVLADRYARGEIDEAEYRSRKAILEDY